MVHSVPTGDQLRAHQRVLQVDWRPGAYPGVRSRLDGPEAQRLVRILDDIDGQKTLLTPTMGGSLPVYLFEQTLDAPIIVLPVANHDNNQHGRDENLRLQNLWDAIEIYTAVLAEFGNEERSAPPTTESVATGPEQLSGGEQTAYSSPITSLAGRSTAIPRRYRGNAAENPPTTAAR